MLGDGGVFTRTSLASGSYRISVRGHQTLANTVTVTLASGVNTVDFGTLRGGDSDGDGYVTLVDFSILATAFGLCDGEAGFDGRADHNGDGCITLLDFSLLRANFGTGEGNEEVAAQREPDVDNGAYLRVEAPDTEYRVGDHFTADLVIDMNGNFGDGGAAYITFDPAVFQVIDLTDGEAFAFSIQNEVDNDRGWVSYAAGTLGEPVGGRFVLARIGLVAVGTGHTMLYPAARRPTRSDVTYGGASILRMTYSATIRVEARDPALYLPAIAAP